MTGIVRLPKIMPAPNDPVGWDRILRQLNQLIEQDDDDHYQIDATKARASDQRILPLVNAGGKLSTQSAQPLTASDAGSSATITVAAHSVQYGFGTVAYNAGSITGLSYSTTYYVYADDPDYEGGAVTYLATTNANTVTGANGRYYVGRITTPAAAGGGTSGNWGGGGGGGGFQIP
ncbi:MAG TPA: hypothetical protein VF193_07525 [Steroidobacter sp.]